MNRLLVILFLFIGIHGFSQSSEKYNSDYAGFFRAEELFQKKQFSAARKEFRHFLDAFPRPTDPLYIKALYYEGVSALELFNNDAVDLLERFNRLYPESIYKHDVHFRLGKYYYQKKDYEEALVYFKQISASDLEPEHHDEFYFKVGYSHFQEDQYEPARNAFYEIKDGVSQYANPALYYYSHIEYKAGSYQKALEGFLKLEKDENFGKVVPYYILQIYYLQGDYEAVTNYVPNLEGATIVNEEDVNHLIGDAYYRTGKYDEAVSYLEAYDRSAQTSRDEDYQLGYAYYRSKQFDKAIKLFDRVGRDKDSMGQVAFYHIGESYMQLNNFASARSAFQQASAIQANPKIEEDALYQFAVLSYKLDMNPYNEAIIAFETYLEKYPNSARKNDVFQYLVNVYTSTKNYGKALASLEKLPNKDITLKKAYQQIAYNHGIELYQKTLYEEAIKTLSLVQTYPIDPALNSQAKYWSADASYILQNFPTAISGYREFLTMPGNLSTVLKQDAYYNIGYAQLYKGDTISAIESFRTYLTSGTTNKLKLADANMRIADSYFMLKDNRQAIQYYGAALKINVAHQDQALFYKGFTHGIVGELKEKIACYSDLINNYTGSKYMQDALFEIAAAYKSDEQYGPALRYFQQLVKDYPNASRGGRARIEIADIYYKQHEYTKAEQTYLSILENYGNDTICRSVGAGLQDVYTATKQHSKLEQYARQYPCLEISNYTLENVLFEPAYKNYEAKKYTEAIAQFEDYLNRYPEGYYTKEVLIYIANSYYETGNMPQAMTYYERALELPDYSFTEFAAVRVSKYYYNNHQYEAAIPYYERLENVSSDAEILFNAKLGLMRSSYQTQDYEGAYGYAKQVLTNSQVTTEIRLETQYALGMSAYLLNRYDDAIPALDYVSRNTTQVIGVESKWTIANIQFNQDKFSEADATIRALLKMKPGYDYWTAKALILQSRILMVNDDLFQAEQTLRSVLDHYPNSSDGIKTEAGALYDELMQLKNQPKSDIAPKGTTIIELNEGEN